MRTGQPSSLELEYEMQFIASMCGLNADVYHGYATAFEMYFSQEQRAKLYRIVGVIRDELPRNPINWYRAWDESRS